MDLTGQCDQSPRLFPFVECKLISFQIMRNLLGTHLGHAALHTLCRLLQDPQHQDDIKLLRGAVFYISMGLFGNKSIPALKCNYTAVLPSLLQVSLADFVRVSSSLWKYLRIAEDGSLLGFLEKTKRKD